MGALLYGGQVYDLIPDDVLGNVLATARHAANSGETTVLFVPAETGGRTHALLVGAGIAIGAEGGPNIAATYEERFAALTRRVNTEQG